MISRQTRVLLDHERTPITVCRKSDVLVELQVDLQWAARQKKEFDTNWAREAAFKNRKREHEMEQLMEGWLW